MFANTLRITLRNIRRSRAYSIVNIAGLALGMACFILIFLWLKDEMSFDRFHEHRDRLYRVISTGSRADSADLENPTVPYALASLLKKDFPQIVETARVENLSLLQTCSLMYGEKLFYEDRFFLADPTFFELFSFELSAGDPRTALKKPGSVVLTPAIAAKYFGGEDPLGRVLRFNNERDLKVTGILKELPENSHLQFDLLAPIQMHDETVLSGWWWQSSTYVLLAENSDREAVSRAVARTIGKYQPRDQSRIRLQPIAEAHFNLKQGGRGDSSYVYMSSVIALFVLLIACVNFMNLSTAKAARRSREIGMRKVVGASRVRLIQQFFGESLLLSFVALVFAVLLVEILLQPFNQLTGKSLEFHAFGHPGFYLGLVGLALMVGLIAGSYPALVLSAFQSAEVLRGSPRPGSRSIARGGLVVFQFSISVILIIATLAIFKQQRYVQTRDLGFDQDNVVAIPMNDQLRERFPAFKKALLKQPGVQQVTAASSLPSFTFNMQDEIEWEGKLLDDRAVFNFCMIDYDYLDTFGIHVLGGRQFSEDFPTDAKQAFMVNETAVRRMGLKDPVGKKFALNRGRKGRIIGVVQDFNFKPLIFKVSPLVFALDPAWLKYVLVRIQPDKAESTLVSLEALSRKLAPGFPHRHIFLDEFYSGLYRPLDQMRKTLNAFAFLSIFISCLGLFGLTAYVAEQRSKEIGVRKVLGASQGSLILMFVRVFGRWVLLACLIAFPLGYLGANWFLRIFVYRTSLGMGIFLVAGTLSLLVALVTLSYQSVKASLTDPVKTLHHE